MSVHLKEKGPYVQPRGSQALRDQSHSQTMRGGGERRRGPEADLHREQDVGGLDAEVPSQDEANLPICKCGDVIEYPKYVLVVLLRSY